MIFAFNGFDPLIVIVAQLEKSSMDYNNAHQCLDNVRIAQPLCKFVKEINEPSEIKDALESAIKSSMTPPYGPSVISIPINILAGDATEIARTYGSTLSKKVLIGKVSKYKIRLDDIKKAIGMIKKSDKNIIVIGDGVVKTKGLSTLIKNFSKQTNIPVIATYSAKGVMGHVNKQSFGVINSYINVITEQKAIEATFNDVDNLILIGYNLSEHYPFAWTRGKKKTIINLSAYENIGHSIHPDINIIGDLSVMLNLLLKQTASIKKPSHPNIKSVRSQFDLISKDTQCYKKGITPTQILHTLNEHFSNDYILANDIGMHRHVSNYELFSNKFLTRKCPTPK